MPFYDPSKWELVKVIQQNKKAIVDEFNKAVERKLIQEKFNATTSFDGFTIYMDSGTMTGIISVYGYRK